jgi:hypothetical protein
MSFLGFFPRGRGNRENLSPIPLPLNIPLSVSQTSSPDLSMTTTVAITNSKTGLAKYKDKSSHSLHTSIFQGKTKKSRSA